MSKLKELKKKRDRLLANAEKLGKEELAELKKLDTKINFEVKNSSNSKPN